MQEDITLITGANGEIGQALLRVLEADRVLALDLNPLDPALAGYYLDFIQGDILDRALLEELGREFEIRRIYHLAAILSTKAESDPHLAHRVNVEGTMNLLNFGLSQSEQRPVQFLFPSSIAVYGLEAKEAHGPVGEQERLMPTTVYGAGKLYCERLGQHFAKQGSGLLDFRALRFPGLISAETLPSGGTTDYGPEMLHFAAAGRPYRCFVRPDTRLPFLAMPDAIRALQKLTSAPSLPRCVYNVTSFSPSAEELYQSVVEYFPSAEVSFEPDPDRQAIVDSWPAQVDDSAARRDWGWSPEFDLQRAFAEYLVPAVTDRYPKESR
ncbi:MAG: NAD-dependent epimerase/dehydratase family protein [Anaerolineae bacterium]|nr:MAG: NAD-dependent epimerase/dehydratase family protein [Anaerolineae bacterium]